MSRSFGRELVDDAVADRDRRRRVMLLEPGDHAERGRLAAARRPDEDEELAVRDVDREVLDRVDASLVDLVDLFELHFSHVGPPSSSRDSPGMERRPAGREHGVVAVDGNVLARRASSSARAAETAEWQADRVVRRRGVARQSTASPRASRT